MPNTEVLFLHPLFRKMAGDYIRTSFIYLEPIKRNFHLDRLVIIVDVPNRHQAFYIKHCPILAYLSIIGFCYLYTSKASEIFSCDSSILAILSVST
ncbi:MAG: hypothetical protein WA364_17430, partial [Candidatus Nitrosopolaris sp.]